jgi:hypothetical protein
MRASVTTIAGRFLRWEFVPEAVLLVGLTAFFVHQNDAATSAFKSTKAVAIMTTVTALWLVARVALARLVRFAWARAATFTVAAALALSVVVLPAYDNETVIEPFPAPAAMPGSAPTTTMPATVAAAPPVTPQPAPAATSTTAVARPATPATIPVTPATTAAAPATTTTAMAPVAAVEMATVAPADPQPAPAGPQLLRTGMFRGIDHRASGTVSIYRQPDGRYVVGLEDIDIQPGPDYDLYVVPGENREGPKGGVRLDDLRGNRGTQFYDVPAGTKLEDGPWTVLVWCQTFAVPVAEATPA